jgi:hypothetical protein
MKRFLLSALLCLASLSAFAQGAPGVSRVDPFIPFENSNPFFQSNIDVNGLATRSQAINPAERTLVLISAGQSLATNVLPTLHVPTNATKVDNFNFSDGASYPVAGSAFGLLGCSNEPPAQPGGPGNINAYLADLFITNGIFDRVIIVPIAIGGTLASDWATGYTSWRFAVAMGRLANRGMVPGTTNLTFAVTWMHGESDGLAGTSQATYMSLMQQIRAGFTASGFICPTCRFFINIETFFAGISPAIAAAQVALVDNVNFFAGANLDTMGPPPALRQANNPHLTDAGAVQAAQLMYNAMHASGAPF